MEALLDQLNNLKTSEVKQVINQKMQEFKQVNDVFSELCGLCHFRSRKSVTSSSKEFCNTSDEDFLIKSEKISSDFEWIISSISFFKYSDGFNLLAMGVAPCFFVY